MKIGIKYCGGCNPTYNRTEFVNKIINENSEIIFESVRESEYYETILIVNGCQRSCSNYQTLRCNNMIFLNNDEDFLKINFNKIPNKLY